MTMTDTPELPPLPERVAHVHSDGEICADKPIPSNGVWPVELVTLKQAHDYAQDYARATRLAAVPQTGMPIETAPKDGTEILAWREDCGWFIAQWTCVNDLRTTSDKDRDELDEESLFSYDWFGGDSECTFRCDGSEAPTHWMPLPPAPDAAPAASSPSLPVPGNLGDPGMPTESDVDQAFHDATEAVELTEEHASIAREWFSVGALEFAARYRAASSPEAADERAAFEAWADDQGFQLNRLDTSDDAGYHDLRTQGPWEAWQARAALASAPAGAGEGASQIMAAADKYWEASTAARYRVRAELETVVSAALAGEPAVAADEGRQSLVIPPLNDALREILGRPNFACIRIAQTLRASGVVIAAKAEDEQATVLHWLLTKYAEHGDDWMQQANKELSVIAKAASQDEEPGSAS